MNDNKDMTKVDGKSMKQSTVFVLKHKAIFTLGDRSFRWEYPANSPHISALAESKSPKKTPKVLSPTNRSKGTPSMQYKGIAYKGFFAQY